MSTCPRAWPTPWDAIPDTILDGEVHYLPGKPLYDKMELTVDKALLDAFPDGLTLVDCKNVTLDDSLTPADVLDHLAFYNCKSICCPDGLQSAVRAVAVGPVSIGKDEQADAAPADPDTQHIEAMSYTL